MANTTGSGHRASPTPSPAAAHALLVADSDQECRVRAASWVDEQLAAGAKVFYKGRLEDGQRRDQHWLVCGLGSSRTGPALASGQLEFSDFAAVVSRCGGTTEGLRELQREEAERAVGAEGWSIVAMTQESARRPMADDAEAADFAEQEAGYDEIAARLPLSTLCQLSTLGETRAAVWESAALHHDRIVDRQWSSHAADGCWYLAGELDAHAVPRFGAALYGALRARREAADDHDLRVDLSAVTFLDFACAQSLTLTARAAGRHQRLVLAGTSAFTRRIVEVAGRPDSLRFDGTGA